MADCLSFSLSLFFGRKNTISLGVVSLWQNQSEVTWSETLPLVTNIGKREVTPQLSES